MREAWWEGKSLLPENLNKKEIVALDRNPDVEHIPKGNHQESAGPRERGESNTNLWFLAFTTGRSSMPSAKTGNKAGQSDSAKMVWAFSWHSKAIRNEK